MLTNIFLCLMLFPIIMLGFVLKKNVVMIKGIRFTLENSMKAIVANKDQIDIMTMDQLIMKKRHIKLFCEAKEYQEQVENINGAFLYINKNCKVADDIKKQLKEIYLSF